MNTIKYLLIFCFSSVVFSSSIKENCSEKAKEKRQYEVSHLGNYDTKGKIIHSIEAPDGTVGILVKSEKDNVFRLHLFNPDGSFKEKTREIKEPSNTAYPYHPYGALLNITDDGNIAVLTEITSKTSSGKKFFIDTFNTSGKEIGQRKLITRRRTRRRNYDSITTSDGITVSVKSGAVHYLYPSGSPRAISVKTTSNNARGTPLLVNDHTIMVNGGKDYSFFHFLDLKGKELASIKIKNKIFEKRYLGYLIANPILTKEGIITLPFSKGRVHFIKLQEKHRSFFAPISDFFLGSSENCSSQNDVRVVDDNRNLHPREKDVKEEQQGAPLPQKGTIR